MECISVDILGRCKFDRGSSIRAAMGRHGQMAMPCWRQRWRQTRAVAAALRIRLPASTSSLRRCAIGSSQQWVMWYSSCVACCLGLRLNAAHMHGLLSLRADSPGRKISV